MRTRRHRAHPPSLNHQRCIFITQVHCLNAIKDLSKSSFHKAVSEIFGFSVSKCDAWLGAKQRVVCVRKARVLHSAQFSHYSCQINKHSSKNTAISFRKANTSAPKKWLRHNLCWLQLPWRISGKNDDNYSDQRPKVKTKEFLTWLSNLCVKSKTLCAEYHILRILSKMGILLMSKRKNMIGINY